MTSFKPRAAELAFKNEYGVPAQVPIVGTVGRLPPWKGQDRFLRSMRHVADLEPSAWFLIDGGASFNVPADYPVRLRQLADDLGIADRVVFTGQVEDVRPALSSIDVFVHAGDPEPFGLVVLEAMPMARPVVSFGHGALPEIIADGDAPRDSRRLARHHHFGGHAPALASELPCGTGSRYRDTACG